MSRRTSLPTEGRPEHALSDAYPLVVNMRVAPYACVGCVAPCDEHSFRFGVPDCERRHAGTGEYRDGQQRFERWVQRILDEGPLTREEER